ncbi:MAG: Ig-like domain repeat protein, partial [Actinomycetota bacterium]|nr:Ig-like domain repeat protein [Actinomycetota bacterium]
MAQVLGRRKMRRASSARAFTTRRPLGGVVAAVRDGGTGRLVLCMLVLLAFVAAPFVAISPAHAGVGFSAVPEFQFNTVTPGQVVSNATFTITNNSDGGDAVGNVRLDQILLVPSCAAFDPSCSGANADPGVFALTPTGTGAAGTACAGLTFNLTVVNPTNGQVSFTRTDGLPVILGPTGSANAACQIIFGYTVLKVPTKDSRPATGVQTEQVGSTSGQNLTTLTQGQGAGGDVTTVAPFPLTLPTTATSATIGSPVSDSVTITGPPLPAAQPTGNVVFTAFGPGDLVCAGPPVFTSASIPVNGSGTFGSGSFTPVATGSYRFVVAFTSTTASFPSVTSACGAAGETALVSPATPTITTQVTPPGPVNVGGAVTVTDTATVSPVVPPGGPVPTGTVTFTVFADGPLAAQCTGLSQTFTVNLAPGVAPAATATSPAVPVTQAGTYRFVATYNGDPNFSAVSTACGDANENLVVNKLTPAIATATTPAGPVTVGTPLTDTATVSGASGGPAPTGTVTFRVFADAAGAAPCSSPAQVLPTVMLTPGVPPGPGVIPTAIGTTAPPVPTVQTGTYRFTATYNGDANYAPAATACGDANENVTVNQAPAIVTSQVSPSTPVDIGTTVTDTAIITGVAGVPAPSGTVVFTAFNDAAGAAQCSGPSQVFPAVNLIAGPPGPGGVPTATATSPGVTTTRAGTVRFRVTYSGDANFTGPTTTACADPNENAPVNKANPTISTQTSAPVGVGNPISDTATVMGGSSPTGTVTFRVFRDPNCATQIFTSTNAVNPATGVATSDSFPTTQAGTYQFTAAYSGDLNNNPAGPSPCGAEPLVVGPVTPGIVTTASPSVPAGGFVFDTATVTGFNPTGTVTFRLFSDAACTVQVPGGTSTNPVSATNPTTSTATSNNFTLNATGTYRFVATYNGDTNNAVVTTACADPAEQVVITTAQPTIVTQASATVPAGGPLPIRDVATVSGGVNPTGTVTFQVFNNPTCSAPVVFSSTNPLNPVTRQATSDAFVPLTAGTYRFVATYSGDANNAPVGPTDCNAPNEQVTVTPAAPAISTQASGPVNVGGTIRDVATITGGANPTGTVTFRLFNDATCTNQVDASTTPLDPVTRTATSGSFITPSAGTYRFVATYSGDANNSPVGPTGCDDPAERVTVARANPTLTTNALPTAPVGSPISDSANLVGGANPTGSITFTLFGPNNATCGGAPIFTSTVPVNGNGTFPSGSYTPAAAGTYRFVATYSGDANNSPSGPTACADPAEASLSQRVSPTIRTVASPGVQVGGQISDTAFLSGGFNPTGTVTFTLFGPDNANCSGPPVFTSTVPVNGTGGVTSAAFTTPAAGVFRFVATYSGDANNNGAGPTACGDPDETIGAGISSTGRLTTVASGGVSLGGPIADTATLSGTFSATGTITFRVFGPANPSCSGTPLATSTKPVNGNGNYVSDPFTPTVVGTYRFVAAYSGDANNVAVTTACDDPLEAVVIAPLPTISVDKTALPESMPVPGGTFVFNVVVTNTGTVPVTITTLTDD